MQSLEVVRGGGGGGGGGVVSGVGWWMSDIYHIPDRAVVYLKLIDLCEEIWSIKFNLSLPPTR